MVALVAMVLLIGQSQAPECADAPECREAALEAAAQRDYERFHDLAWRAVQKGQRNDPELMYLLARAQSLSGRPGDALVMLRRLPEMGVATDARENDDFRNLRDLAGWPAVEAAIAAASAKARSSAAEPLAAGVTAPSAPVTTPPEKAAGVPGPEPDTRSTASDAPVALTPRGEEALRLSTARLDLVGLAYDSTSRRFVLGDRQANKLIVADEVFNHVNDLVSAAAAGFGGLTALGIDARRGDLWVTSTGGDGTASVHKLQLVSGRLLFTVAVPEELAPARFSDLSIEDDGTLLLLDAAGSRLLTMRTAARRLERPVEIGSVAPSSLATSGEIAYVAHKTGLSAINLSSGARTDVRAPAGMPLAGLQRIRWHRGSLIGIQTAPDGNRLVRIRFARGGTRAAALEPLDETPAIGSDALAISRDAAYYVAEMEGGTVIRRVVLR